MTPTTRTPFTRSVYALVAAFLGRPRAPHAVAGALSALPEEIDVPWWRVISSSVRISMSSIHHTAQIQRAFLEDEGVRFMETGRVDWDRYEWNPNEGDLEQVLGSVDA